MYIGITCNGLKIRCGSAGQNYKAHNPYFWNAIEKYGWEDGFTHEILVDGIQTQEEAEMIESEFISKYDSTNREHGYNVCRYGNIRDGVPIETRRKMSEQRRGRPMKDSTKEALRRANTGRVVSEESKKKMSIAHIGKHYNTTDVWRKHISDSRIGFKMSDEQKELLRKTSPNKIPVNAYDMYGNYIDTFDSVSECARKLCVDKSHILDCCNHRALRCKEYQFRFVDDVPPEIGVIARRAKDKIRVGMFDDDGNMIGEYESIRVAAEKNGADPSSIAKCLKGKLKHHIGYVWKIID